MKLQRWLSGYERLPCVQRAWMCAPAPTYKRRKESVCLCVLHVPVCPVLRVPVYHVWCVPVCLECACVSCVCPCVYSADTQIPDDWPATLSK